MRSSDIIFEFLREMMDEEPEEGIKFQRNELANRFKVVPSQINYVISSRFTPEQGYIVESVRGGGGFISIRRVNDDANRIMHIVNSIGSSLDANTARIFVSNMLSSEVITETAANLIISAVSESSLQGLTNPAKDQIRAKIFKNMLLSAAKNN